MVKGKEKHQSARTFSPLSVAMARTYCHLWSRPVVSFTLNVPAIWASLGYVLSQWVASRRDRGSGLGVRASGMSVVCRSLKIKLCVSGLAPKCVTEHSRFVLWHFWRLLSNPTNLRPRSSQSVGLMVKTIVMEECEKWKSVSFESMVHHKWWWITNSGSQMAVTVMSQRQFSVPDRRNNQTDSQNGRERSLNNQNNYQNFSNYQITVR